MASAGRLRTILALLAFFAFAAVDVAPSSFGQSSLLAKKKKKKKKKRKKKKKGKKAKKKKAQETEVADNEPPESTEPTTPADPKVTASATTVGATTPTTPVVGDPTTGGDVTNPPATDDPLSITGGGQDDWTTTAADDASAKEKPCDKGKGGPACNLGKGEEIREGRAEDIVSLANESTLFITTWIGLNRSFFTGSSEFTGAIYCRGVPQANTCSASPSGYSAGIDAWFARLPVKRLQLGVSVAIMQAAHGSMAMKGNFKDLGVIQLTQQTNLQYVPIMAMVRYTIANFYLGVGGGYALNISKFEKNSDGEAVNTGFAKEDGQAFGSLMGFIVPLGRHVSLDIFVRSQFTTAKVSRVSTTPVGKSDLTGDTGNTMIVTPGFSLSYYVK